MRSKIFCVLCYQISRITTKSYNIIDTGKKLKDFFEVRWQGQK